MTTDRELRAAEARYQRAAAQAEQARERRNAAVRAAVAARVPKAHIARVTGLTRSRVGQIADGHKADW